MAILASLNLLSEQRLGVDDMRRIESASRNDFDELVTGILTGTQQGYIVRGFSIPVSGAIGSASNGLQLVVDPGAVMHIAASVSGTIFQTPLGTPNQILNSATNPNVIGSFTASSTNYVGIDYNRFADSSTNIQKFLWDASSNSEITVIAPASQTLTFQVIITTSVWALNVLPVAIVTTDSNGNVTSITDARWMFCSLETGGLNPNPNFVYPWASGRTQPPVTTTSDSVDPFTGGDKQLDDLKSWMNAVMTTFLEIKGTPSWFTGSPSGSPTPLPSITSIFQDLGNTVITGSGEISNGILPNSDPLLVTTGNISVTSNQLQSLASVVGLSDGDFIFGTGIVSGTTVVNISGSTITMSNPATLNGTGITVSFFSPSVITSPGQINWNDPIEIRVIGSSLTYTLAANPTSADITLADDQVAYINLVRDVPITPNLIFIGGSPVINSVGNVSWTTGLLPGDYVRLASDTVAGNYQIFTVNSASQVTLTANVLTADNTGPLGAHAVYAFGSYSNAPTPSTNRNIFITSRESAPVNGNFFWLFLREDDGGAPKVYIRFLSQELDNGESVQVSGTTSLELLKYIGAASASSSSPQYVAALNPGSLQQISQITLGAGSTVTASQYFLINSSANAREYVAWFNVDGVGTLPAVANTNASIEIPILSTDSATAVATKVAAALNSSQFGDFSATSSAAVVTVTNTSAGLSNPVSNGNVSAPFATATTQMGTGAGNFVIHDGDSLTLAIKELDQEIGNIEAILNSPSYDETIEIVASGATPPTSLNGPISPGTNITLPNNSREGNVPQQYSVGKGMLLVFLNGQFLDVESGAYTEIGTAGLPSSTIQIQIALVVGDELEIRISSGGGGAGGGGVGPSGPAGPAGPPGENSATGPVAISTKTSNYTVLASDCFLRANCVGSSITFTLPPASSVTGRIFYVKKVDASPNSMNIAASGGDLIDGFNTQGTNTQYESFSIISTGSGYDIF
jgi:hypothetical protein